MWKWMGLFLRKKYLLGCWGWLSSKLDWGSYIFSIAKTTSKKIGALIHSMKFLLRLLCISINVPYGHAWNTVVMSGVVLVAVTSNCFISYKKRICMTIVPSLAASLEPLGHHQNVASLSLFYRCYFGRCSSELAKLIWIPYSRGRFTYILHGFSVTIPRCYKDIYVNSFFPRTTTLWNSLPIECFPFTFDLNDFKSRINIF